MQLKSTVVWQVHSISQLARTDDYAIITWCMLQRNVIKTNNLDTICHVIKNEQSDGSELNGEVMALSTVLPLGLCETRVTLEFRCSSEMGPPGFGPPRPHIPSDMGPGGPMSLDI